MIRVALIGCGAMGRHWLRVIRANPRFELVSVVDPVAPEATERIGPTYEFDAAIVATPTMSRAHDANLVLGSHVLVEKPLASTVAECCAIVRAAEDSGNRLAVGHVERFNPAFVALQREILDGRIGAVVQVETARIGPRPAIVAPGNNAVLDLAVHDVDLLALLLGPLRLVSSTRDVDEGHLAFSALNGACGTVEVGWRSVVKARSINVIGTSGALHASLIDQTLRDVGRSEDIPVVRAEPLALQLDAFADLIETGNHGRLATGIEAMAAVELVTRA